MAEFRRLRIDLDGVLDAAAAKRLANPPGYDPNVAREQADASLAGRKSQAATVTRRQEALFAMAWSPVKQLGMLSFMMYMAGTNLHLFSIMATINGLYQPLSAIIKSGTVFVADPEGKLNVAVPRLMYCAIHAAGLLFAVYRINMMGLLPTNLSDWAPAFEAVVPTDLAVGGLMHRP